MELQFYSHLQSISLTVSTDSWSEYTTFSEMLINYLDYNCDGFGGAECVFVHYLHIQAVCNTLPRFLSLFYNCGGVAFLFYLLLHVLVGLHEDFRL